MTQFKVSTVDWAIVRCSFEFGGMTIQNDPLLNWGYFGFILAVSDDLDIHFQTICLPLTLHSMRLALSLFAFSSLAAADGNLDGGWSSAPRVTDENKQFLNSALGGTRFSKSVGYWRVCVKDASSLCTQVVSGTNYLFSVLGCLVPSAEGNCSPETLQSCSASDFLVQINDQPWTSTVEVTNIQPVSSKDLLPMTCRDRSNYMSSTLLYWMYFVPFDA